MAIHSNINISTNVIVHVPTQTTICPQQEMVKHYIYLQCNNQIEQVVMNTPYPEKVFARFVDKQLYIAVVDLCFGLTI